MNNKHQLKIARNIEEYLEIIKDAKDNNRFWFRGMSKADRYLEPSLFREKRVIGLEFSGGNAANGEYYRKSEAIMKSDIGVLEKFKKKYKELYPEKSKNYNLIDYLYIMQHYDIPTRLLDFSTNELIALYFSVTKDINSSDTSENEETNFFENEGFSDKGSSIHCINPIYSNEKCHLKDYVFDIDNVDDKEQLYKLDLPLCIKTNNNDPRIVAQSGVFMLYGYEYLSYDKINIFIPEITKIFIPNYFRKSIKKELKENYNIYHSTVYPDMKGISMEIIEDIESEYTKHCKEVFGN